MKKLILLLLCAVSSFSLAATQASDGSNLRDSIFRIYRSMPADTARTQFLKDIFVHNIDKDWSAELLDSALASAISMKDVESWRFVTNISAITLSGWMVRIWIKH